PRGTAIEVSGLGKEERAALQAMSEDLEKRARQDSATSSVSMESSSVAPTIASGESGVSSVASGGELTGAHAPPVHEQGPGGDGAGSSNDDRLRSFAPFASRDAQGVGNTSQFSTRRRVDLPDPDQSILS